MALSSLEPGARVLDAACGVGVDALALARRGILVTVSDASEPMLSLARQRLTAAPVDVEAINTTWQDLPAHVPPGSFDAVLCSGNSIGHLSGEEMVASFESFAQVLAPGGLLVLDTHDWEVILAAGNRTLVSPRVIERGGRRCLRTYVWHVAPCAPDTVWLELGFVFLDGESASMRTYELEMHPFTRGELRERLRRAGFDQVALDAVPGHDRYTATARRIHVR